METETTAAMLFELAISAELLAEELYRGLALKFSHVPEIASLWEEYAADEVKHALWLERLCDSVDAESLAAPGDPLILQHVNKALRIGVEEKLAEIENLQDAYELATELENSETNAVFEFLLNHYSTDDGTRRFLLGQLTEHLAKLKARMPALYRSLEARRGVKAQSL